MVLLGKVAIDKGKGKFVAKTKLRLLGNVTKAVQSILLLVKVAWIEAGLLGKVAKVKGKGKFLAKETLRPLGKVARAVQSILLLVKVVRIGARQLGKVAKVKGKDKFLAKMWLLVKVARILQSIGHLLKMPLSL